MGEITLTDAIGEPVATLPTKGFEYDEEFWKAFHNRGVNGLNLMLYSIMSGIKHTVPYNPIVQANHDYLCATKSRLKKEADRAKRRPQTVSA